MVVAPDPQNTCLRRKQKGSPGHAPVFVSIPIPIILRLQSLVRIRRHDLPPTLFEVFHNWAIFSILFEVIFPRLPIYRTTADPWDVVAYLTGGLLAYAFWHRPRPATPWA